MLAVAMFAGLPADQEWRWRRSDDFVQSHFLPDGTPAMSVTTFGDTAPATRGRVPFSALAVTDSGWTDKRKAAR